VKPGELLLDDVPDDGDHLGVVLVETHGETTGAIGTVDHEDRRAALQQVASKRSGRSHATVPSDRDGCLPRCFTPAKSRAALMNQSLENGLSISFPASPLQRVHTRWVSVALRLPRCMTGRCARPRTLRAVVVPRSRSRRIRNPSGSSSREASAAGRGESLSRSLSRNDEGSRRSAEPLVKIGAGNRIRTGDPQLGNLTMRRRTLGNGRKSQVLDWFRPAESRSAGQDLAQTLPAPRGLAAPSDTGLASVGDQDDC
jgi:hypothetical protein